MKIVRDVSLWQKKKTMVRFYIRHLESSFSRGIACVANFSDRVNARKLERERSCSNFLDELAPNGLLRRLP